MSSIDAALRGGKRLTKRELYLLSEGHTDMVGEGFLDNIDFLGIGKRLLDKAIEVAKPAVTKIAQDKSAELIGKAKKSLMDRVGLSDPSAKAEADHSLDEAIQNLADVGSSQLSEKGKKLLGDLLGAGLKPGMKRKKSKRAKSAASLKKSLLVRASRETQRGNGLTLDR